MKASRHIKRAFDKGKSWQGAFFRAKIFARRDSDPSRLAVIISKKTLPGAVQRNRVRRRIKAAFAEYLGAPLDIAVIANKSALEADFSKIKQEAEKCANFQAALPRERSESTKKP